MKIEKVPQPIYRVEFGEDVLNMLKDVLGNLEQDVLVSIGADVSQYNILVDFYNLLESIE